MGVRMEQDFWQGKWARNEIGFHESQVNPYLRRHWPSLGLARGARVLVPLCGKSLDLVWLLEQGHRVVGVEWSELAVRAFFAEQRLEPVCRREADLLRFQAGSLEIVQGDFFTFTAGQPFDAFYDRAALIALPRERRADYVDHLRRLIAADGVGLLVTLEYEPDPEALPPFSVDEAEVEGRYGRDFVVERVDWLDALASNDRLRQRGLTRLEEKSYLLRRR